MLLKSIIIFVIYNYMRKNLNINMCKVCINYKSLFIERQFYVFMSLAQSSCAEAASSRENPSNNMSTAEGNVRNVNVKNLVQTIVQHLAFRETINSILTTTNQNQEQLTYIVLIISAEIPESEGSIYSSSFYRQLPNY